MVNALASGARGPRFDLLSRRGKFLCLNTLSLVSFIMTLDKCAVFWIGTLIKCPHVQGKSPLVQVKESYGNLDMVTCRLS